MFWTCHVGLLQVCHYVLYFTKVCLLLVLKTMRPTRSLNVWFNNLELVFVVKVLLTLAMNNALLTCLFYYIISISLFSK